MYELPIPYFERVHEIGAREAERFPEWAPTMNALKDDSEKLLRKEEEIRLADTIVTPSKIVADSLPNWVPRTKVEVVPYGAPAVCKVSPNVRAAEDKLKILYAGNITAQKGIHYLIRALSRIDIPWTACLAGKLPAKLPNELKSFLQRNNVSYLGHLPHSTLLETMHMKHVLLFPTLFDGFGMVVTEALANGLPVIATDSCGAADLIDNWVDGVRIRACSSDDIAEAITRLYHDEDLRLSIAHKGIRLAEKRSWISYQNHIRSIIE